MIEPSHEAAELVYRIRNRFIKADEAAAEIDALTEQRVAGAKRWRSAADAAGRIERDIHEPAESPKDAGCPGSASNTDAAQESFQCLSCHWHHGHNPAEWFTEEAKRRGFIELVKRERVPFVLHEEGAESSPTQTVAAPRPTAGDVERAREVVTDWQEAVSPEGWLDTEFDELRKMIATALYDRAYAARAELLAQIREPTLHRAVAQLVAENLGYDPKLNWRGTISDEDFPQLVEDICDAVADKLTEAK